MKVLAGYIKRQLPVIILFCLFSGIFEFIFYLYGVRADAVKYAFLICGVCLLAFFTVGFARYYIRHKRLLETEKKIAVEWMELPKPMDIVEEDYSRVLEGQYKLRMEMESEHRIARQDIADYYSMWAHQIKTPIAAMQILLQTFEESENYTEQRYGKSMKMELFKIEQYVEMALSYLKMENMGVDMVLGKYHLEDIVKQAVRKYSRMFILKKIRLRLEPLDVQVLTDEKWLVFVVEQILSNALKYTVEGEIAIYLKEEGDLVLVVEDTGIGIQEEDIPRVFEKGFTGYNGRKDKKATGIGLYLCKSIMDKLGHGIWIEQSGTQGTRVFMSLGRKALRVE